MRSFDIPAQSLATALQQFTEQSGVQVGYTAALGAGLQSPGVSGSFSAPEALSRLLTGTGLTYRFTSANAVVLEQAPAAAAGAIQLGPVRVQGESNMGAATWGDGAAAHVRGYVAMRTATGTKTNTPIIEVPQSISVVTADQARAQGATDIKSALAYTPGVTSTETGNVTIFSLRGFQAGAGNLYLDGVRYASNFYQGQPELYGLESVEVLRGPASVLFGSAVPGGIVNSVSKRPTQEAVHEINLEYGSFNRKQLSADFGGKLTGDGVLSYRLTGLVRDSDTFVDYVPDNRIFVAPAIAWKPSDATSLTVLGNYRRSRSKYIYGASPIGTVQSNPNGQIPRSRFIGEPDQDRYNEESMSLGYIFEHRFSPAIRFRQVARYEDTTTDLDYATFRRYIDTDQREIARGFAGRTDKAQAFLIDSNLSADWSVGLIENTTLVGFDLSRQREQDDRYNMDIGNLDLFDPVYGAVPTNYRANASARRIRINRTGVYLQNQAKIAGQWVVLLGGRYDSTRDDTAPFSGERIWEREKNSAFTGRAGLVYLADNGLAPYVSFSQSFEPASGVDRNGSRFDPTRGEQFEAGIRFQPPNSSTLLTASVYHLTQKNVLTPDPVDANYSVQIGEVRSKGFEFEAKTKLGRDVALIASYSHIDAKITESNTPAEVGLRQPFTPRNQFSLWTDYDNAAGLTGLKLGGGIRYVGSTTGFYYISGADVPSYTVFDAIVSYSTGPWLLSINARNITDKTYVSNCTYGCFYGEPRNVVGTLTYRW